MPSWQEEERFLPKGSEWVNSLRAVGVHRVLSGEPSIEEEV
jgi:hypothetical protein